MRLKLPSFALGASLLLAGVSAGFSQTTNTITILNPSFESQTVANGTYSVVTPTSWSTLNNGAVTAIVNPGGSDGRFNPPEPSAPMDGSNYCQIYTTAGSGYGYVYQDTGLKWTAGVT